MEFLFKTRGSPDALESMWIKMEKSTTPSEKASPSSSFVDNAWPSFVNGVPWVHTKFIFPRAVKRPGSRTFLYKAQEKVLLQTMQFQDFFQGF